MTNFSIERWTAEISALLQTIVGEIPTIVALTLFIGTIVVWSAIASGA